MEISIKDIKYDYGKFKIKTPRSSSAFTIKSEILGDAASDYNTLGKLEDKIQEESSRALSAEALKANSADVYTKAETYSLTQLNNMITTPNQKYVTVEDYASLPESGEADTIYRVSNWDGSLATPAIDITKYSEYAWDGTEYIFLSVKSQIGEVYDISAANSGATYADLAAALGTNGANVSEGIRKGGMSVKFVQSSDNKYVQWRYMLSSTTNANIAKVTNWVSVDKMPTAGSKGTVESQGVLNSLVLLFNDLVDGGIFKQKNETESGVSSISGYYINNKGEWVAQGGQTTKYAQVHKGDLVKLVHGGNEVYCKYALFDSTPQAGSTPFYVAPNPDTIENDYALISEDCYIACSGLLTSGSPYLYIISIPNNIREKLDFILKETPIEVTVTQDGHYIGTDNVLHYNSAVPTLCYSEPIAVTKGQIILVENISHAANYAGYAYTDAQGSSYEGAVAPISSGSINRYCVFVEKTGYISLSFNNTRPGGYSISRVPANDFAIILSRLFKILLNTNDNVDSISGHIDSVEDYGIKTKNILDKLNSFIDYAVELKVETGSIAGYYCNKNGVFASLSGQSSYVFAVSKGEYIKIRSESINSNYSLYALYEDEPTLENVGTITPYYYQPYSGENEAILVSPINGYLVISGMTGTIKQCGTIEDINYNNLVKYIDDLNISLAEITTDVISPYNTIQGYCRSSTTGSKGTVNDQLAYTTKIIDVQNLDYIAVGGDISVQGGNYHYFALVSFSSESGFKTQSKIVGIVDCVQGVNPAKVIKVPFGAKYAAVNQYFTAYEVEERSIAEIIDYIDLEKTHDVNEQFNIIKEDFYYDAVNPSKVANVRGTEWSSISSSTGNYITIDKTTQEGHVLVDALMKQGLGDADRCYYGANIPLGTTNRPVIIVEGTLNGTNIKTCNLWCKGVDNVLLAQDHEDNLEVTIKGMTRFGNAGNNYFGIQCIPKSIGTADMTVALNITRMFVCTYIEGFSVDDYLRVYANVKDVVIKESALPKSVAYKQNITDAVNELREEISESGSLGTPYSIKYPSDVVMLINYGQSLSVGGSIGPSAANFHNMLTFLGGGNEWSSKVKIHDATSVANFYGTDLLLFEEQAKSVGAAVGTNAYAWIKTLIDENLVNLDNFDFQMLCSTPGESGASIKAFIKNSEIIPTNMDCNCYDRLLFSVSKAKELANKAGKTFSVPCVFWVQGEADSNTGDYNTYEAYYNALKQLAVDLNTDIRAITGQSEEVAIVTYQMSSYVQQYGINKSVATFVELNLCLENQALLAAGQPSNHFYYGSTMYQFNYGTDLFHLVDRRVIGLQAGINAKRLINDKKPLPIFYPKSHWVQYDTDNSEWILSILFDVPCPPARFYYTDDGYHNVNGYQTNFGFKVLTAGGVDIIAETPTIKRGNTVVIRCNQNPVGCEVRYAINGHYGGGNLCDSQNAVFVLDNVTYTFDNFCPTFKGYIIN